MDRLRNTKTPLVDSPETLSSYSLALRESADHSADTSVGLEWFNGEVKVSTLLPSNRSDFQRP